MDGFAGFRELKLFDWTLIEYFKGVRRQLGAMGYRVFAPEVVPFDDPLDRAKQWFSAIEKIRAETGAEKVHLVGHSQGGLDARVLVARPGPAQEIPLGPLFGLGYGPHVASLTTIATPHLGSPIADEIDQDVPARVVQADHIAEVGIPRWLRWGRRSGSTPGYVHLGLDVAAAGHSGVAFGRCRLSIAAMICSVEGRTL